MNCYCFCFKDVNNMAYKETDFVKNLRRTHCKGCRDEGNEFHRYCNGQAVIHCYLVKQYIPNDEWRKTIENDIPIKERHKNAILGTHRKCCAYK